MVRFGNIVAFAAGALVAGGLVYYALDKEEAPLLPDRVMEATQSLAESGGYVKELTGICKTAIDENPQEVSDILGTDYVENRKGMKNVVDVCESIMDKETAYQTAEGKKIPLMPGSADCYDTRDNLETRMAEGQRFCVEKDSETGTEYLHTETAFMGQKTRGVMALAPQQAYKEPTKQNVPPALPELPALPSVPEGQPEQNQQNVPKTGENYQQNNSPGNGQAAPGLTDTGVQYQTQNGN